MQKRNLYLELPSHYLLWKWGVMYTAPNSLTARRLLFDWLNTINNWPFMRQELLSCRQVVLAGLVLLVVAPLLAAKRWILKPVWIWLISSWWAQFCYMCHCTSLSYYLLVTIQYNSFIRYPESANTFYKVYFGNCTGLQYRDREHSLCYAQFLFRLFSVISVCCYVFNTIHQDSIFRWLLDW